MTRAARLLLAAPLALALALAPTGPVTAEPRPDEIPLPTGSLPEGVAAGPQSTIFAGARRDGAIYAADVRTGDGSVIVPGEQGRAAVGMQYDDRSGLLWVAGGGPRAGRGTGTVTAYDGADRVFDVTVPEAGFLNDLVVTDEAVYVTDSFKAELVVVPLGADGRASGGFQRLRLTGDFLQPEGFGANGIRELSSGELLLVAAGQLYRVDPGTGVTALVEQQGRQLEAGDGLELRGSTLYVVNGLDGDEVVVLQLGPRAETTRFVGTLTDEDLDRPTTAALVNGRLYVVNGRFSVANETSEHTVSQLRTR